MIPGLGRSAGEGIGYPFQYFWASLVAQLVKNLPVMWEIWVQSLSGEDPLEEEKATDSSILPGKSHRQRSLLGYSPWGCRKELDRTEVTWHKSIFGCYNWRQGASGRRPDLFSKGSQKHHLLMKSVPS